MCKITYYKIYETETKYAHLNMDAPVEKIRLPYIMSKWPWPRHLNTYYESVKAESEVSLFYLLLAYSLK